MTVVKSMVMCLALANVVLFLWAGGIGGAVPPAGAGPAAAAPPTLRLASEAPPPRGALADGGGLVRAAADAPGESVGGSADALAAAPNADPTLLTTVQRCVSVGPFRDVSEAAHAASLLRDGGYDPRQRVADGEVWAGVWVYMPLQAGSAANEQLLARLKAAGIDEALEMPGPTEGSVISLGLFSEQKRAQARVAQVQALGLNPALTDRKRNGNVYWIDIDLKPTDGVGIPARLQADSRRITRLEVKGCPAAAPP